MVPAEPFSAAWLEEPKAENVMDPDTPRYRRINSSACAEPVLEAPIVDGYDQLVEALFDVGDKGRVLASLNTSRFGDGPQRLSLVRRRGGKLLLRSISIPRGRWFALTKEVSDTGAPESTLEKVAAERVVREHSIDAATAQLVLELWRALIGRAQVVEEVNPGYGVFHATAYVWATGEQRAFAWSPTQGSVLGDTLQAANHLRRIAEGTSDDEADELRVARALMRESLARTHKKEPCLIHIDL